MTWFKVDDAFYRGPKVRKLGKDRLPSVGLWTLCGNWCADNVENNVEDGFVPWEIVIQYDPTRRYSRRLIAVGLWTEVERDGEPGVLFHDWADYQPTRDQRLADREKWRKKKAAQRARRAQEDQMSPGDIEGDTSGTPPESPPPSPQNVRNPSRPVPYKEPTHLARESHDPYVRDDTPPLGPAASGPTGVDAFRLVRRVLGLDYPAATCTALAYHAAGLLKQYDQAIVIAALEDWRGRTGIGPGVLPSLVADHVKHRNGHTHTRPGKPNADDTIRALLAPTQPAAGPRPLEINS